MKATEQYFPVVMSIMLYKVILTFQSVNEICRYDHSNEGYLAVLSCGVFLIHVPFTKLYRVVYVLSVSMRS